MGVNLFQYKTDTMYLLDYMCVVKSSDYFNNFNNFK